MPRQLDEGAARSSNSSTTTRSSATSPADPDLIPARSQQSQQSPLTLHLIPVIFRGLNRFQSSSDAYHYWHLTVIPSLRDNHIVINHLLLRELRTFVTLQKHYFIATCHSFRCFIIHLSTFILGRHAVRTTEHFGTCTIDSTSRRRPNLPSSTDWNYALFDHWDDRRWPRCPSRAPTT